MRVLTLTQPWATLVAIGAKRVETRSWRTGYRGYLAINAASGFPRAARERCDVEPFASALGRRAKELPLGRIICVARLQDVVTTRSALGWVGDDERAFGDYGEGRYAWVLSPMPYPIREPVPWRGALGLQRPSPALLEALALQGFQE